MLISALYNVGRYGQPSRSLLGSFVQIIYSSISSLRAFSLSSLVYFELQFVWCVKQWLYNSRFNWRKKIITLYYRKLIISITKRQKNQNDFKNIAREF